jgi:hypothetical protein
MTDDNVQEYVAYWFTPQPKEFLGEAIRHLVPQKDSCVSACADPLLTVPVPSPVSILQ